MIIHQFPGNNILSEPEKKEMERNNVRKRKENEDFLYNEKNGFFMTVNCSIMLESGISKGDTILVNKIVQPLNGNVVVASVSGDVVIRIFQKIRSRIYLSADAGKVCPMQIDPGFENFEILGVVTHVIKLL